MGKAEIRRKRMHLSKGNIMEATIDPWRRNLLSGR
jgi:hypothetical protein